MVADMIEEFLDHQRVRGFSPRTVNRRAWSLGLWNDYVSGGLSTATATDVERFLLRWPSAQSRYSVRSDLNQAYRYWERRWGWPNPVAGTDAPRLRRRAATPIPPAEVRRAIGSAGGVVRPMIALGAFAGLRCSEIAALTGADIHREAGRVVVREGKGGNDRVLPLAAELAAELDLAGVVGAGALFPGITGAGVGDRIRRHFRAIGVEGRPHDLRHSFGTEVAKRANGNLVLVARLMGHASVTTTQRYVSWSPDGRELVAGLYGAA